MERHSHSEQRRFPVSEGYDRAAVDAYLRDLAAELEGLTRVSGELHRRVHALGGELQALTASLRAGGAGEAAASGVPSPVPPAPAADPVGAPLTTGQPPAPAAEPARAPAAEWPLSSTPPAAPAAQDLDGARLVALNMALEGQPRERTDAYLAERFQLDNRAKLLDEVYAAVEG